MRKFLIATHGTLASGIQNALRIITGEIERVTVIDALPARKIRPIKFKSILIS